jgi:hypothetical protein
VDDVDEVPSTVTSSGTGVTVVEDANNGDRHSIRDEETKVAGAGTVPNRQANVSDETSPAPVTATRVPPLIGPPRGSAERVVKNETVIGSGVTLASLLSETAIERAPAVMNVAGGTEVRIVPVAG